MSIPKFIDDMDLENEKENDNANVVENHEDVQGLEPANIGGNVLEDNVKDFLEKLCSAVVQELHVDDPFYTSDVIRNLTNKTFILFTDNPNKHNNFNDIINDVLRNDIDDDNDYHKSVHDIGGLMFQEWSRYHERDELLNLNIEEINQLVLPYVNLTYKILEQF